jgi:hypothetical protein
VLGAFYNRNIDIGDNERDGIEFLLGSAGSVLAAAEYLQNVSESMLSFHLPFQITGD